MTAPTNAVQAMYFGPDGERLFGWLHRGRDGVHHDVALVICNPFGFEEVCAHRSLRSLAGAAASAGVPTLRFDYAGCGNSEGDEFEPERLQRWVRSVHAAIDGVKQATGARRVCLFGVRLGASFAALAAVERDDVVGLIALAPVVRGRAYLRELTMLGATTASGASRAGAEGLLESAGFLLTREATDSLGALDLRVLDRCPAQRVLIVERDDLPNAAEWRAPLERLGAEVRVECWPGYAGMVADPQRAQVPQRIVDGVIGCLRAWQVDLPAVPDAARALGSPQMVGLVQAEQGPCRLRESVVRIGAGGTSLFGVLTLLDQAGTPPARPAVLMLNAGSVHHIGPNRLWVRLARRWAARGIVVLRLDLSGIGDSPPHAGAEENVVYSSQAAQDIAAALAYLRSEVGATECHLMGLCSGAYHALKAAVAGHDVGSALMINPLTFFWKEGTELDDVKDYELFELGSRYWRTLFTVEPWRRLARGQLDVSAIARTASRRLWSCVSPHLLELLRRLRIPFKHDLASELAAALQRGIRLHFVFASHAPGFELLRRQSGRAMRTLLQRRDASIDFIAGADHTFTRLESRERLVALLDTLVSAEVSHAASHTPR